MPRIEPIPFDKLPEKSRAMYEAGAKAGAFHDPVPYQILAYAHHESPPDDGDRHPNYPDSLLPGSILELVRIRSAQLGGCEPCSASRKVEAATEEAVVCLANPALRGDLDERQRIALELLERLSDDPDSVDDAFFRRMAKHFTAAEIVDLGQICGSTMGMHRFMHTLRVYSDDPPLIEYDPHQIGVTKAQQESRQTIGAQGE